MKKIKFILGGVVCVSLLGLALAMELKPSVDQMEVKNAEALAASVVEASCDASNDKECSIRLDGAAADGYGKALIKSTPSAEPSK